MYIFKRNYNENIAYFFILAVTFFAQPIIAKDEDSPLHTFAVIWGKVDYNDKKFQDNIQNHVNDILSLWRKGIIENVYLNTGEVRKRIKSQDQSNNVVFFIRAKSKKEADKILAKTTFVKHKIADYELFPVGVLWLPRIEDF